MYSSLIDAPINAEVTLIKIINPSLAAWLNHLGLFVGSQILRHDDEINFHPVRVKGTAGDVVVPSGLGIKTLVHLHSGERKPLTEMEKKDKGHIETISGGKGCEAALLRLGLGIDTELTFIRALPHMDYVVLINQQQRTRISEGEAARIWGQTEEAGEQQFYFARKNQAFTVTEILGGKGAKNHLATHGIKLGDILVLESIEQAQALHAPSERKVTISSQGGLRLYLSFKQAGEIVVKSSNQNQAGAKETNPQSPDDRM